MQRLTHVPAGGQGRRAVAIAEPLLHRDHLVERDFISAVLARRRQLHVAGFSQVSEVLERERAFPVMLGGSLSESGCQFLIPSGPLALRIIPYILIDHSCHRASSSLYESIGVKADFQLMKWIRLSERFTMSVVTQPEK